MKLTKDYKVYKKRPLGRAVSGMNSFKYADQRVNTFTEFELYANYKGKKKDRLPLLRTSIDSLKLE